MTTPAQHEAVCEKLMAVLHRLMTGSHEYIGPAVDEIIAAYEAAAPEKPESQDENETECCRGLAPPHACRCRMDLARLEAAMALRAARGQG